MTWVSRIDSILPGSLPVSIRKLTCRYTSPRDQWSGSLARAASAWQPKGGASRNPVNARLPALPVAPKARALTGSPWSGSGLPGAHGWDCPNSVDQLLFVIEPINDSVMAVKQSCSVFRRAIWSFSFGSVPATFTGLHTRPRRAKAGLWFRAEAIKPCHESPASCPAPLPSDRCGAEKG